MSFWSFLRDMFVLDWLFGHRHKGSTPTNHNNYTDCECGHDYAPPRSSGYSHSSWDNNHYSCDDYYHDSHDDYAHDFDNFDDDF